MCACQCDCPSGTGPIGGGGGGAGPGGGGDNSTASPGQSPAQLDGSNLNAQLFPNPNHGQFTLSLPAGKIALAVEVQNILGQQVMRLPSPTSNDVNINLNQALIGTYLLRIRYANGSSETHKFIIH